MQGKWKDTVRNYLKDKAYVFFKNQGNLRNTRKNTRIVEEICKNPYSVFEQRYIISLDNLTLGEDIPWKITSKDSTYYRRVKEKIVQRKVRAKVRDYIFKGDFEKEIPCTYGEKTAVWLWS